MRFTASIALVAALVPAALAQSVTISPVTLTQCADANIAIQGSSGPYYVAVIPASDPCTEDAIAEFYNVSGNTVDYYVNLAAGTTVQIYVLDVNGVETWGEIETVGNGDSSCLPGSNAAASPSSDPSNDPATPTNATVPTSSSSPAPYVPPSPSTTPTTYATYSYPISSSTSSTSSTHSSSSGTGGTDNNAGTSNVSSNTPGTSGDNTNTPANAADNTGGASSLNASLTLIIGAFVAVIALFQ